MNRLRDRLGRAGTLMPAGAGGFLAWWGASLAAWLPEGWRRVLGLGAGVRLDAILTNLVTAQPRLNEDKRFKLAGAPLYAVPQLPWPLLLAPRRKMNRAPPTWRS
mgnify:CR=1 FL=1